MEQQHQLPTISIEGTDFLVDVDKAILIEKGREENTIAFEDMYYDRSGYRFDYDTSARNMPLSILDNYISIHIPNLTELDPAGMARKYGMALSEMKDKADVDVVIDQKELALRESGQLPVIVICDHIFYVDLAMDSLRPKDDFTTTGIRFKDIDDYYLDEHRCYRIPYNPATHAFEVLDYENIKAIPKGLLIIEIPYPSALDPVAYTRINGFNKDAFLMENGLHMHRGAKVIPWDETPIKQIIARNLKREPEQQQKQSSTKAQRKRGRGI